MDGFIAVLIGLVTEVVVIIIGIKIFAFLEKSPKVKVDSNR